MSVVMTSAGCLPNPHLVADYFLGSRNTRAGIVEWYGERVVFYDIGNREDESSRKRRVQKAGGLCAGIYLPRTTRNYVPHNCLPSD